jgi:hypothetical protein
MEEEAQTQEATQQAEATKTEAEQSSQTAQESNQQAQTQEDNSAEKGAEQKAEKPKDDDLLFGEDKKEGEDGEEAKEAEKKDDDKEESKDDAPEINLEELKLPEDFELKEADGKFIKEFSKENKLTQEQAQKMVDVYAKKQQEQVDFWLNQKAEWRKEIENDPVLGGANLTKTKDNANKIIRRFVDDDAHLDSLKEDLVLLGLGNKRSFVKFLNNIHAQTGNDTQDGKASPAAPAEKSRAQTIWPDQGKTS